METTTRLRDTVIVGGTWLLVITAAWLLINHWSPTLLLPLAGFVWFAAPLTLSRFASRPLLISAGVALVLSMSPFLFLGWTASLVFDLLFGFNPFPYVLLESLLVLPGALVGAVVGLQLRRWDIALLRVAAD